MANDGAFDRWLSTVTEGAATQEQLRQVRQQLAEAQRGHEHQRTVTADTLRFALAAAGIDPNHAEHVRDHDGLARLLEDAVPEVATELAEERRFNNTVGRAVRYVAHAETQTTPPSSAGSPMSIGTPVNPPMRISPMVVDPPRPPTPRYRFDGGPHERGSPAYTDTTTPSTESTPTSLSSRASVIVPSPDPTPPPTPNPVVETPRARRGTRNLTVDTDRYRPDGPPSRNMGSAALTERRRALRGGADHWESFRFGAGHEHLNNANPRMLSDLFGVSPAGLAARRNERRNARRI